MKSITTAVIASLGLAGLASAADENPEFDWVCPDGFGPNPVVSENGAYCYKLLSQGIPAPDAEAACADAWDGASLAAVRDSAQAYAVVQSGTCGGSMPQELRGVTNYFIGLNDMGSRSTSVDRPAGSLAARFWPGHKFFNGANASFILSEAGAALWADGEPNDLASHEPCVEVYPSGVLNDISCTLPYHSCCEVPAIPVPRKCPEGWVGMADGVCYKLIQKVLTFEQAQGACTAERQGSHLAIIRSHAQGDAVVRNYCSGAIPQDMRDVSNFWVGLTDKGDSGPYCPSGSDCPRPAGSAAARGHSGWHWTSGESTSFIRNEGQVYWAKNEPNNYYGGEECVMVYDDLKQLNDIKCTLGYYPCCETPAVKGF